MAGGLLAVANAITAIGQAAQMTASSLRDAAVAQERYESNVGSGNGTGRNTTSSMGAAGSESTGGMSASHGGSTVTSKGMATAIATARRSL